MLERGRISCQRHTYTSCSDAERNVVSFCWESEGACWRRFGACRPQFETEQQRTWNHIPKRNCMWECKKNFISDTPSKGWTERKKSVVMRHACQATNQSSHGELSFHHNPHLRLCWGLRLYTSRVIRSGGARLKHAAHFTYCHCCELCALKQKPGALLENAPPKKRGRKLKIPTANRTHHRIRSPSIKCSGT